MCSCRRRDKTIRLRMVAMPSRELKVLLRDEVLIPNRPKMIENVVRNGLILPGLFDLTSLFLHNCGKWELAPDIFLDHRPDSPFNESPFFRMIPMAERCRPENPFA